MYIDNVFAKNGTSSVGYALTANKAIVFKMIAMDGTTKSYTVTQTIILSSDVGVLSVTNTGGYAVTKSADNTTYTISTSNSDAALSITATANYYLAGIRINANSYSTPSTTQTVTMPDPGWNYHEIRVLAEDGISTRAYNLSIFRAYNSDNNITAVTITDDTLAFLTSTFNRDTTSYSYTVPYYTNGVVVTAVLSSPTLATLKINGVTVASSTQSSVIALTTDPLNGANTVISVQGIAQDGGTRTWTWTIFRPAVPAITATVSPCATYSLDVSTTQTRYLRISMPAGEFLHVIGTSNVTSMAPVMYLRKNALPSLPSTFDASSHAVSGDSYSYITQLFAVPATTYYLQFGTSSFASGTAFHKLQFSACLYSATNATVQGTVSGSVALRQWTFFNAYTPMGFFPSSILFFTDPTSVCAALRVRCALGAADCRLQTASGCRLRAVNREYCRSLFVGRFVRWFVVRVFRR